jgi:hypothetical protein
MRTLEFACVQRLGLQLRALSDPREVMAGKTESPRLQVGLQPASLLDRPHSLRRVPLLACSEEAPRPVAQVCYRRSHLSITFCLRSSHELGSKRPCRLLLAFAKFAEQCFAPCRVNDHTLSIDSSDSFEERLNVFVQNWPVE